MFSCASPVLSVAYVQPSSPDVSSLPLIPLIYLESASPSVWHCILPHSWLFLGAPWLERALFTGSVAAAFIAALFFSALKYSPELVQYLLIQYAV